MAKKEFTKKELLDLLNQHQVDGKLSFNSLGEIIFDSKFPEALFQNAQAEIIKARNDEKRYKELGEILLKNTLEILEKQKQIVELSDDRLNNLLSITRLKDEVNKIEKGNNPLEQEFWEIKKRIAEREGK